MKKRKILELLRELLNDASIAQTDADDASGCNTRYYVDQEQLIRNIDAELAKPETRKKCKVCNGLGETVDSSPCHKCHGYG